MKPFLTLLAACLSAGPLLAQLPAAAAASPSSAPILPSAARGRSAETSLPVAPGGPRGKFRELIVRLKPGGDLSLTAQSVGATLVKTIPGTSPTGLLRLPANQAMPICLQVQAAPKVELVEWNRPMRAPIVPTCAAGAGLSGSGCIAFYDGDPTPAEYFAQPAVSVLQVGALQDQLSGNLSIVAVIDTGIDASHPVLAGKVLPYGYDFLDGDTDPSEEANGLDDDGNGLIDEAWGHGTHLAGTIALINPDARILPLRVLDSDGKGSVFDVAEAIAYAVSAGADVLNLSLGMQGSSAVVAAALQEAHDAGVQIYAAAGNTGSKSVQFPASWHDALGVAAVDEFDVKAPFSSYGNKVDVSAPGTDIYGPMPGGLYARWSGTSMATAVASGAGSLLHSLTGKPFATESADALQDSSKSIEHQNPNLDDMLGSGRIDPPAAANKVLSS
jgi:subtilisin family serine protease